MPHSNPLREERQRKHKVSAFLSQNIKGAELKIIEDTGHVVNEENPETLANILTEYYSVNA